MTHNFQAQDYLSEQIKVTSKQVISKIMAADVLFEDRWVNLSQPIFWRQIMLMPPDSVLINVAKNRQVLEKVSLQFWNQQSEAEKTKYKTDLKRSHGLDSNELIYVTTGKSDFFRFHEVFPSLGKGVEAFEKNGVDPWYAQAILLIESPAQLKKSVSGAYGPFQLMPGVAKHYGLSVGKYQDERADFERSAYAASQLIKGVCIPSAKKILNQHGLSCSENELWFRLMVMHVYHAGAGNVAAVVNKINPQVGSQDLIQKMWVTSAASFGNNSQNYTQLVLAAQWILHDYVYLHCDDVQDACNQ